MAKMILDKFLKMCYNKIKSRKESDNMKERDYQEILKRIHEVEEEEGICLYSDCGEPYTLDSLKSLPDEKLEDILDFLEIDTEESMEDLRKKVKGKVASVCHMMGLNPDHLVDFSTYSKDDLIELDQFCDSLILTQSMLDTYGDCGGFFDPREEIQELEEGLQKYSNLKKESDNINSKESESKTKLPTPRQMKAELDKRIFGNEDIKKKLTTAIYRKLVTMEINKGKSTDILDTPNILLCGATGTSKTYNVKCIGEMLNIPVYTINASQLTPNSYKGTGINDEIMNIVSDPTYKPDQPKIIFLDEIDKLAGFTDDSKEIGTLVMGELLKLMEAKGTITLSASSMGRQIPFPVDMDTVIFVFAGAFDGITNIVKKRLGISDKKSKCGFGVGLSNNEEADQTEGELYKKITKEDLRTYGLTPEFLGRIGEVGITDYMTEDMLLNILEKQNSALKQNIELLKHLGHNLILTKEGKEIVCDKALKSGYGARSLSEELFIIVSELLYDLDSYEKDIVVDNELLENINYI